MKRFAFVLAMAMALATAPAHAQRVVLPFDAPEAVRFGASKFKLPDPAAHRVLIGEGLVAFVAEDAATATVELTALVGISRLDDPAGKEGLAEALGYAITTHGPKGTGQSGLADALRRMDARFAANVDNEHLRVTLSCLAEDLPQALELFARSLREPQLDAAVLQGMRRRGPQRGWSEDDPRARPEHEFPRTVYGDHPAGRRPSAASLEALTVEDLAGAHRRYFVPSNMVIAASGGFSAPGAVSELKRHLAVPGWRRAKVEHGPPPPIPPAARRTLHVFDTDRLQGFMLFGHLGERGRGKDRAALEVANYVLGGGGAVWKRVNPERPPAVAEGHFDARLFVESRSKRGLSNDTSSYVPVGFRAPALVYGVTLGRPESIAYLLQIADREWKRIRDQEISDEELEIARGALTEGYFEMRFSGAHSKALALAEDFFFEGGHAWSEGYARAIRAVTRADVLAAARRHFRAEELVAVLVGPLAKIRASRHPEYPARLEDFGAIQIHPW